METISVTRKGVEKLVGQLNKMSEGLSASVEYKNTLWIIDVAGQMHYTTTILEAIQYIQGVMAGIKFMKLS
jgi:hypothetical protein